MSYTFAVSGSGDPRQDAHEEIFLGSLKRLVMWLIPVSVLVLLTLRKARVRQVLVGISLRVLAPCVCDKGRHCT